MSQPKYLILYPDNSRAKVKADQLRLMLREGVLEPIDTNRFRYKGEFLRLHGLGELRLFATIINGVRRLRAYPGVFIREHRDKRAREILETPARMAQRLGLEK